MNKQHLKFEEKKKPISLLPPSPPSLELIDVSKLKKAVIILKQSLSLQHILKNRF